MDFPAYHARKQAAAIAAFTYDPKPDRARRAGLDAAEDIHDAGGTEQEVKAAYWAAYRIADAA